MAEVTQAEFARLKGVSRKTITLWKQQGRIALRGDLVDVEASEGLLTRTSGARSKGVTCYPEPVTPAVTCYPEPRLVPPPARGPAPAAPEPEAQSAGDEVTRLLLARGALPLSEAERIKENALALKHTLEARRRSGELVEFGEAEAVMFATFRAARDAWLNWPVRVGPLIAAELGLEADKVTEVLRAHVHTHLAELGEPEPDFAGTELG